MTTTENIVLIDNIIKSDRHLSVRQIEEITGINRDAVHKILTEELNRRYLCATWIPHSLKKNHKKLRVESAKGIISKLSTLHDRNRLYAVCDETWVFFQSTRPKSDNKACVAPC